MGRLKAWPLDSFSHSIGTSQPPEPDILLELAAVVPPGVALETFSLKKIKRVWRGEFVWLAGGSDEINSLMLVDEVQNNFGHSPLFSGVKLIERELQGKQVEFKIIYQLDI